MLHGNCQFPKICPCPSTQADSCWTTNQWALTSPNQINTPGSWGCSILDVFVAVYESTQQDGSFRKMAHPQRKLSSQPAAQTLSQPWPCRPARSHPAAVSQVPCDIDRSPPGRPGVFRHAPGSHATPWRLLDQQPLVMVDWPPICDRSSRLKIIQGQSGEEVMCIWTQICVSFEWSSHRDSSLIFRWQFIMDNAADQVVLTCVLWREDLQID